MSNLANLIANVVRNNEKKMEQLKRVQSICLNLTSDDGISVDTEMYYDNIVRFRISGTRCGMVITYNTITGEIVRKPAGARPWHTEWEHIHVSDILRRV